MKEILRQLTITLLQLGRHYIMLLRYIYTAKHNTSFLTPY